MTKPKPPPDPRACDRCGTVFHPARRDARFCCDTCRTLHHLEAKRDKERAERVKAGLPVRLRERDKIEETEAERLERLRRTVNRLPR